MNCKWKYITFSTHHGMEPPAYECECCGDKIKTDDDPLPMKKCDGQYKKIAREIIKNSALSDEQKINEILKILKGEG